MSEAPDGPPDGPSEDPGEDPAAAPAQPSEEAGAPEPEPHQESGLDLARAVARGLAGRTPERARRTFDRPRRPGELPGTRGGPGRAGISGAHPDQRDPQSMEAALGRFVADHGWGEELRVHGVFSRWTAIVGPEVAQHVSPVAYAEGVVTVQTDSTAWATQMKLLAADLVRRLNEVLGEGTVTRVEIRGPHLPRWTRGRYRVRGRGPRDTFG